jgi:threonylcarbamoyladenosine tRNA methylthiotransferase MtaB
MIVKFISFGCKVNLTDTEYMKNLFADAGFTLTETDSADVFVINSCTVTDTADSKLKKTIRRIRKSSPGAIIAVTGCFPQSHPNADIGADIMHGTSRRDKLPGMILDFCKNPTDTTSNTAETTVNADPIINTAPPVIATLPSVNVTLPKVFEDFSVTRFSDNTRAFLKIQDGCNMNCAYCIIPKSRGHFRSKPLESVKKDAAAIYANGYKEIVLTGINLAFYGTEYGLRLADAVEAVAEAAKEAAITTICEKPTNRLVAADTAVRGGPVRGGRIRLGSLEPEMFSEADVERLAKIPGVCPQFHLSLQSACDKTLLRMNRRYNINEYIHLVDLFGRYFPDCAITTDVMTGFPGETDEEFAETCVNLEKIGFADIHVFPFSRRAGTVADTMFGQLPESVKQSRARIVADIAARSRLAYLQSMIGKTVNVLFEREKPGDFYPHGFAENYVRVSLPNVKPAPGETYRNRLLAVKVTGVLNGAVLGKIV